MTKGIRQHILYSYLSLTLVIIVLLATVLVYQGRGFLVSNTRDSMLESSELRADIVALRIQQEVNKLVYLANTGTAKALNGTEILSLLKNMVSDNENQLLVNALYARPDGAVISLHNETGSISDRPYFRELIRGNMDYTISDPIATQDEEAPIVVILASIRDPLGSITGVLGSAIDLSKLSDSLTDSTGHDTAYSWILDEQGTVIAYPSSKDLVEIGFPESAKPTFASVDIIGAENLKTPSGTFTFVDPNDKDSKEAVYSTIPGTNGWKLCTAISRSAVSSPINGMMIVLAVAALLLGGAQFVMGGRISRSIINPIEQVAFSAENLERGSLRPVDEPQTPLEINHLVRSFNHMANALFANTEELENTVEEREKALKNITGRIIDRNDRMSQINGTFLDISTRDKDTHLLTRNEILKQLELIKSEVDTGVTESFSLLLIGLDNFSFYTQTFGSEAGNMIIQKTAKLITSTIRSTDIASRYDKDNFMIILSGTNQVRADIVIKKLTQAFKDRNGFADELYKSYVATDLVPTPQTHLDLSISVVIYTKKMGLSADTLVKQAEGAMKEIMKEHQKILMQDDTLYGTGPSEITSEDTSAISDDYHIVSMNLKQNSDN